MLIYHFLLIKYILKKIVSYDMIWNLITNIVNTKIIKRKDIDRRKNDNIYLSETY